MKRRTYLNHLWGGTLALTFNPFEVWAKVETAGIKAADELLLFEALADLIIELPEASISEYTQWANFVHCYATHFVSVKQKEAFFAGSKAFASYCQTYHQAPFEQLERQVQKDLLESLFAESLENQFPKGTKWIKQFRTYLMFAFYTSERGATQQLTYLPIPGKYEGDLPMQPNQKAWTL